MNKPSFRRTYFDDISGAGVDEGQAVNIKLVNTFPSFTSISVVDNIYATLWAGIVQDVESVVSDFLMTEGWEYGTFVKVAEARNIVALHRCAFSLFAPDRSLLPSGDRSRRGRNREQMQAYRRIVSIILNTAKDVWLEPTQLYEGRIDLMDLKRNVCGLYLLYYLWHNQIPRDPNKVRIKYSIENERCARLVGQKFLQWEKDIPNSQLVKRCYQFTVTALSKRNALCYTYIIDEPKLEYSHWQHMRLKNCGVRKALTSVNSNSHFYRAVSEIEVICSYMTEILKETREISKIPVEKSLFFRKILPAKAISDMVQLNKEHQPVSMKLPFDYSVLLNDLCSVVTKNMELLKRSSLQIDCLLQTDKAPQKIRAVGLKLTKACKHRYVYNKQGYEKKKADFNRLCEINRVPSKKIPNTRKYRTMETPAWLFIQQKFSSMFTEFDDKLPVATGSTENDTAVASTSASANENLQDDSTSASTNENLQDDSTVPSYCEVQPFNFRRRVSPAKPQSSTTRHHEVDRQHLTSGTRTSGRLGRKPTHLESPDEVVTIPGKSSAPVVRSDPTQNFQDVTSTEDDIVKEIEVEESDSDCDYGLDEDEKLIKAVLQRERILVIGQSTEELKEIYGIKRLKKT